MTAHDHQTFFTPEEFCCLQTRLLSQTYNLAHTLLKRSAYSHVFIPIRSLQYLAIIENNTFWFVDSLAYGVILKQARRSVSLTVYSGVQYVSRYSLTPAL
jgi:hypothetical protein